MTLCQYIGNPVDTLSGARILQAWARTTRESAAGLWRDRRRSSPAAARGSAGRWAARSPPLERAWCWSRVTSSRSRRRSRRFARRAARRTPSSPTSPTRTRPPPSPGQAAALVGPIALLINNASTLGPLPLRLLLDTDCEDLERALAVNLVGAFRLTKVLAGPMVLRGAGTIVNVTSDAATEPYERWGAYGASKAALEQLGRVWAAELAGTGVRLFTVDPGEMDTRMHADAIPDANRAELSDPRASPNGSSRSSRAATPRAARGSRSASDPRERAPPRRRFDEARAHLPRAARRRPPPGDRPRGPRGCGAARDAHARAARAAGARRSAGRQRRRHPPRFAARDRRGRASGRGAPDRRARRLARGGGRDVSAPLLAFALLFSALRGGAVRRRRLAHAHRRPSAPAGARRGRAPPLRCAPRDGGTPRDAVAAIGGAALRG